jgi:hypothetical protein
MDTCDFKFFRLLCVSAQQAAIWDLLLRIGRGDWRSRKLVWWQGGAAAPPSSAERQLCPAIEFTSNAEPGVCRESSGGETCGLIRVQPGLNLKSSGTHHPL